MAAAACDEFDLRPLRGRAVRDPDCPMRGSCLTVPLAVIGLFAAGGCGSANWFINGFGDPTQVGNFLKPVRLEIRESLSLLEEPLGIQDAEEPTPDDTVAHYVAPEISPGDFLRISIFELVAMGVDTQLELQVSPSGFETMPELGPVKVAGFTPRNLELELKELLREADILNNAEVKVSVLRSEAMQYTVFGQIPSPGNYPLSRPDFRLLSALAAAGGLQPQIEKIYVIREGAKDAGLRDAATPDPEKSEESSQASIPFTMSDVSGSGTASSLPATSTPATTPATAPSPVSPIDELEILEGAPQGRQVTPEYDPETGVWVLHAEGEKAAATGPTTFPEEVLETRPPVPTGIPDALTRPFEVDPDLEDQILEPRVRIIEIPTKGLREGDPRYNIVIRSHDLINVPLGNVGEYFMGGNVGRPGAYSLTGRRITVKQAIVAAGGFGPLAWPARADLIRRVSNDEEQIIQVDLDAIFAGKAPDFFLRPDDVVNVGSSPAATFLAVMRNAFRLSYGFGFVYDRNFGDSDSFAAREQVKNRRRVESQLRGIPF